MANRNQPNIVLVFTDNQQASTLGCYANAEVRTPHLDRMAREGVTFDNAFCPNAFCSPCRASLLTGKMPSQHGIHSWIDDRRASEWPEGWHALAGEETLPETLQRAGYRTGLFGKYHLGVSETAAPGFDRWCTMADGHVRSFWRNRMTVDGTTFEHEGHTVDFFTDHAIRFIEEQASKSGPFFAYVPYPAPYGHWPATKEEDRCRFSALYDNSPMESIPRRGLSQEAVAGFLRRHHRSGGGLDYSMTMRAPNDLPTLRNYYAQISMVDDGVGRLRDALDRNGLAENTVVIFTSDHGLSLGHHGFWGHGAATFPSNLHHAAHSVPLLVSGVGARPNTRRAEMALNLDLYATVLDLAGVPAPQGARPSRSLAPLLRGESPPWTDDVIFAEQEETRVLRTPNWAFFKRFGGLGDALFDLEADPEETINIAEDPAQAERVARFSQAIAIHFARYSRKEADPWQGGRPIQNTERADVWQEVWGQDWAPVFSY